MTTPNAAGHRPARSLSAHDRALVVAILLTAAAVRLVALGSVPPGLHFDEAVYGLLAEDIRQGARPIFFPPYTGREPLYMYAIALLSAATGPSAYVIRLTSALAGIVTVALAFALGLALHGRRVGIAAAGFVAISYWHLTVSRNGYPNILIPPIEAAAALALWRGWVPGSKRAWIAGGAFSGLVLYTYLASRLWPVVLAIVIAAAALAEPARYRRRRAGIGLALVAALAVITPLVVHFVRFPADFWERANQVLASGELHGADLVRAYLGHAVRSLQAIALPGLGDPRWHFNLPGRPMWSPPTASLLALGTVIAVTRARELRFLIPLVWVAVMALPGLLTLEMQPAGQRMFGVFPAFAILPAIGLAWLADRLRWHAAWPLLLAFVLAWEGGATLRDHFGVWANAPEVAETYHEDHLAMAGLAREALDAGHPLVILSEHYRHPTVAFAAAGVVEQAVWADPRRALPVGRFDPGGQPTVYLAPEALILQAPLALRWLETESSDRTIFEVVDGVPVLEVGGGNEAEGTQGDGSETGESEARESKVVESGARGSEVGESEVVGSATGGSAVVGSQGRRPAGSMRIRRYIVPAAGTRTGSDLAEASENSNLGGELAIGAAEVISGGVENWDSVREAAKRETDGSEAERSEAGGSAAAPYSALLRRDRPITLTVTTDVLASPPAGAARSLSLRLVDSAGRVREQVDQAGVVPGDWRGPGRRTLHFFTFALDPKIPPGRYGLALRYAGEGGTPLPVSTASGVVAEIILSTTLDIGPDGRERVDLSTQPRIVFRQIDSGQVASGPIDFESGGSDSSGGESGDSESGGDSEPASPWTETGLAVLEARVLSGELKPGDLLDIEIEWARTEGEAPESDLFTIVLEHDDQSFSLRSEQIARDYSPEGWSRRERLTGQYSLVMPHGLEGSTYDVWLTVPGTTGRLHVGMIALERIVHVFEAVLPRVGIGAFFDVPEPSSEAPNRIELIGLDAVPERDDLEAGAWIELQWRAERTPSRDLKVFVHIIDSAGVVVAQHDAEPAEGERPMRSWLDGEIVFDAHPLAIPQGDGPFTLAIGLYDPLTGERMPIVEGRDRGADDKAVRVPLPAEVVD